MILEYFPETDTLYIDITNKPSLDSKEMPGGIVLDFDEKGNLSGIEIDNASKKANIEDIKAISLPKENIKFS